MSFFSKKNKPVFREIFLSDKNRMLRIILLCVFLGIGIIAIAVGLMDFLSVDPGWQEVEVISDGVNCADDFTLQYYFTDSGAAATAIQKDLVRVYSDAAHKAYQLFTPDVSVEGMNNIYAINHAINTELEVDPVLYEAFALLETYGSRNLYLGPLYQQYNNIFFANSDDDAMYWDPDFDPDSAAYAAQITAFARDEECISLKLLGDNKVMLQVSAEYEAFATDNEIENYIDFHWMTNAFITDYFADLMLEKGYTKGFIASRDGFTRNLNEGTDFSFNLFDMAGDTIFPAGVMVYNKPSSIVFLHDYPMTQEDSVNYHVYGDGTVVSSYVDISDGMDRSSTAQLVSYSEAAGCAEILMEIMPVFIADSFEPAALVSLTDNGIHSIWCEDRTIYHTNAALRLENLLQDETYIYSAKLYE